MSIQSITISGVAPKQFSEGDSIEVKAIKLTSVKGVVPYEYYSLPFCKPKDGQIHYKSENLGEVLRGDRIVNTPFDVKMRKDLECSSLCAADKVEMTLNADQSNLLRRRIHEDYHVHLLIDNLPIATRYQLPNAGDFFDHGYRLGRESDGKVYVNNHLDIILRYHEPTPNVYRVVGFEARPRTIASNSFEFTDGKVCKSLN
jgi:transmembrane 9 superfamily protein 2/4